MGPLYRLFPSLPDSRTVVVALAAGVIIGTVIAVYLSGGLDVSDVRPVLEPMLNSIGLVWP